MEFFAVITEKVENPIDITEAKTIIEDFFKSDNWQVIDRNEEIFLKAIDLVAQYNIHLWDAAIAACMKEYSVNEIVTENKKDFEKIPDINVTVPF